MKTFALPFRLLLGCASLATAAVALWLLWVIMVVLPGRDPDHIPMWRAVAVGFLAYSALCWFYLTAGSRNAALRWTILAISVVAMGLGVYGIADTVARARATGDFEGYLILMGLILFGHGASAVTHTLLAGRIAHQS